MNVNKWYRDTIEQIMTNGKSEKGRNGLTLSNFDTDPYKIDLSRGKFPLVSLKSCSFSKTILEGMYFLSGSNKVEDMPKCLRDTWWSPWIDDNETFGRFYGTQLRHRTEKDFDQLRYVLNLLKYKPHSRRICLSLWAPEDIFDTVLPACHSSFIQFYSRDNFIDMYFYQRSGDVLLGVPHNIAWASFLLILVANEVGKTPGRVKYQLGDAHVYQAHLDAAVKIINYSDPMPKMSRYELKEEYRNLIIDAVLIEAKKATNNNEYGNKWDLPIRLLEYKPVLKLGKLELVA